MKIGIITPSYNQGRYLRATIDSVISQSRPVDYYAIYDSCSSDETLAVLNDYRASPAVHRIVVEKDKGQADAINRGFAEMPKDIDIMAYLNSDDQLAPGAIARVMQIFDEHSDVDFITGARRLMGRRSRPCMKVPVRPRTGADFYLNTGINQEASFWRRSLYEAAGNRLDVGYKFALDYELWFRMSEVPWHPFYVNEVLGYFRIHSQAKTTTQIDTVSVDEQNRLRSMRGLQPLSREEYFRRVKSLEAREMGPFNFFIWRLKCQIFKRVQLPLYS